MSSGNKYLRRVTQLRWHGTRNETQDSGLTVMDNRINSTITTVLFKQE